MITDHARERITERLDDAGYAPVTIGKVIDAVTQLAARSSATSEAARIVNVGHQVNQAYGDRSNGNYLWAIFRGGNCITAFLRRDNQPPTPAALRVEQVSLIAK